MSILNMYTNVRMNVTETMTVYKIIDMPIFRSIIKRSKNTTLQVPKSNRKIREIRETQLIYLKFPENICSRIGTA